MKPPQRKHRASRVHPNETKPGGDAPDGIF
jgi:hypothetical protein